ncbi:MAG: hypothetical protein Q8O19_00125 [Rectinemataceae bacterium]|nr:hypothetical protein [Rectinemataceae bacterium]
MMTFSEKMKGAFDKGIDASRDLLNKASVQAQAWSEQGMLKIEIVQLRSQARKLTSRLGAEVYECFSDKGLDSVSRDMPGIGALVTRIRDLEFDIDKKENLFRESGGHDSDLDDDGRSD